MRTRLFSDNAVRGDLDNLGATYQDTSECGSESDQPVTSKEKTGPSECRRGAFASNGGVDGGDRGGKQDMKLEGLASALEEVSASLSSN